LVVDERQLAVGGGVGQHHPREPRRRLVLVGSSGARGSDQEDDGEEEPPDCAFDHTVAISKIRTLGWSPQVRYFRVASLLLPQRQLCLPAPAHGASGPSAPIGARRRWSRIARNPSRWHAAC